MEILVIDKLSLSQMLQASAGSTGVVRTGSSCSDIVSAKLPVQRPVTHHKEQELGAEECLSLFKKLKEENKEKGREGGEERGRKKSPLIL